jgi:hypothetical protein
MKTLINLVIVGALCYGAGFYSGLAYRGSVDQDQAFKDHVNELTDKAVKKGKKVLKVIEEE